MPKRKKKRTKKTSSVKQTKTDLSVNKFYDTRSFYCQVPVSNYEKSIKFYSEVLELKPTEFSENGPDPKDIGWYEFQLPLKGAILGLGHSEDVLPSRSVVIPVTDLDGMFDAFSKKKAALSEITDIPNMISFFTINDPDNNPIMFVGEPRIKA